MIEQLDNKKKIEKIIFMRRDYIKDFKEKKKDGKIKQKKININIKNFRIKTKYFHRIDVILMDLGIILYHININSHNEDKNYNHMMKANKLIVMYDQRTLFKKLSLTIILLRVSPIQR